MPDALSKTVPIWCAVLNRLLFPKCSEVHHLRTPSSGVSLSEQAQIQARLDGFVQSAEALQLDTLTLRATVKRPLVPYWITPDSEDVEPVASTKYNVVICCTGFSTCGRQ